MIPEKSRSGGGGDNQAWPVGASCVGRIGNPSYTGQGSAVLEQLPRYLVGLPPHPRPLSREGRGEFVLGTAQYSGFIA